MPSSPPLPFGANDDGVGGGNGGGGGGGAWDDDDASTADEDDDEDPLVASMGLLVLCLSTSKRIYLIYKGRLANLAPHPMRAGASVSLLCLLSLRQELNKNGIKAILSIYVYRLYRITS